MIKNFEIDLRVLVLRANENKVNDSKIKGF